jgi:hypothetical protein
MLTQALTKYSSYFYQVAELNIVWRIAMTVLVCSLCLASAFVLAQSQTPTAIPTIDPATMPTIPPTAGSVVKGFVLDSNGNPVPGAVVTLGKDGKIWQHGKITYNKADNPQTSYMYSDEPNPQEYALTGLFWYGIVEPGQYIITAEIDGYIGSTNVSVGDELVNDSHTGFSAPKIMVNVTLEGYRVPALTQEQLSYTGGIAGTLRTYWGYGMIGVNMSLWKKGLLVKMPKNPQASYARDLNGSKIDFLFEHLAPGQYQVVAEYHSPDTYYENVTVNVTDHIESVDIVLSKVLNRHTPSPGIAMVLLSIGIAMLLVGIIRRTR